MDEHSWREWWRFAVEDGGIGTCVAALTRVTNENANRLAFRQGELITVLFCVLPPEDTVYSGGLFLGFCGYSIGLFDGKEVHSMSPLRSAGTVDATLPAAERPFAPVSKLASIHVPPGRQIVRFEERVPPRMEPDLRSSQGNGHETISPTEFTAEGDMAISAAMLAQHPLDMSYVTSRSFADTHTREVPAVPAPAVPSANQQTPSLDEEPLWADDRLREPTYSIYDAYFRPSMYIDEEDENENDDPPVPKPPPAADKPLPNPGTPAAQTSEPPSSAVAPTSEPPSSAFAPTSEPPSSAFAPTSEPPSSAFAPSRQALLSALSGEQDESMLQPRPMDTLMQSIPRTENRLLDQADESNASVTRAPSGRSDMVSHAPMSPGPHTSPLRQKTAYRPLGTQTGRDSPWSTGTLSTPPRAPPRLGSSPPTSDTTLVGRPMSPYSSPRLHMSPNSSIATLSPRRAPTVHPEPLSRPAPSLFGSPQRRANVDLSEHALPERAQLFQQWSSVLTDRSSSSRTHKYAVQLVHAGVPGALRGRVWLYLAEKKMHPKPDVFESVQRASLDSLAHPEKYPFAQLIEQDLDQCFPLSQPFVGLAGSTRDDIRRVLHMYAFYCPEVGYTEGMCLVVGVLLTHLQLENTFWLLDTLVHGYGLHRLYLGDTHPLQVDNLVVDELVRMVDAPLHQRLAELRIEPIMFLPGWMLPLFVRTLPWAALLRVWDMLLCYGYPFLLRVAVAVVCLSRGAVIGTPPPDRSTALRQLVFVHPAPLTVDGVLGRALELPITDKELTRMQASAERLVGDATRPSYAIERNDPLREQLQGKPVTKKTLRVLMGRPRKS